MRLQREPGGNAGAGFVGASNSDTGAGTGIPDWTYFSNPTGSRQSHTPMASGGGNAGAGFVGSNSFDTGAGSGNFTGTRGGGGAAPIAAGAVSCAPGHVDYSASPAHPVYGPYCSPCTPPAAGLAPEVAAALASLSGVTERAFLALNRPAEPKVPKELLPVNDPGHVFVWATQGLSYPPVRGYCTSVSSARHRELAPRTGSALSQATADVGCAVLLRGFASLIKPDVSTD